ncbi:MAG: putative endonuclease [Candidatus Paceibacteria bacterium]|jgi:putative endonuclease
MVNKMEYYTYIIKCADDTLYTGIATDLVRRVAEHNGAGKLGSKYTRARRPVSLVYSAEFPNRSESMKEESRIKKLSKKEKKCLVDGM